MSFAVQCAEHSAEQGIGSQQALGTVATHLTFQPRGGATQLRLFVILLYARDNGGVPLIDEVFNSCQLHRLQEGVLEPFGWESLSNGIGTRCYHETRLVEFLHKIFQPAIDALTLHYRH